MRGQVVSFIGCLILGFAFTNTYGWSGPTQISNNSSSSEASVPKVASGPSGRLYVVYQQKPEWRTYFRERSATGTWGSVEVLGTNFVAGRPDVIEDNAGRVHVFYPQRNANSNYDILHSYRTPGGVWTTITASGDAGMFEDYPRVARDSAGNLHLVYAKTAVESDAGDIIYRKWNGSSWSGETVLGQTNKAYHQRPDITIDPSDQIHVAWAANGGSRNIIRYKRYSGGAWSGVSVIGQSIVDGGSNGYIAYPRIACASSNNIIACWHDDNATSNNSATVYNTSSNGGTNWGTQQVLMLGHYHALESGNGVVYFACEQQPGGKAVLYKSWNGSSWTGTETVVSNSYWKGWIDLTGDANGEVYIVYDDVINSSNYHVIDLMDSRTAYQATLVSQSIPSQLQPGQMYTCSFTFLNTGTVTWDGNTKLGCSNPRDRSSPFYNSADWPAANRPTIVDASTAPGQNGTFTFIAKAPTTPGTYTENYELVQEMVTWFVGTGDDVTWTVTVVSPPGALSGTITDGCGNPLAGVSASTSPGSYSATTAANGSYTISSVPAGTYTVTASKSGYTSGSQSNVTISSGQTTTVNMTLVTANSATLTSVSLSSPTLIADDTTPYTVTLKASHPNGAAYINDMRIMFDLNFSAPANARGYMAWGATTADVTKYGGTMTVQGPAGGSGYWGFDIGNWGYEYIIPVGCTTSTSGNERTVVWTFKVKPDWFYAGPLTGNFIGMFLRECDRTTGWQYSNTLFGYTFSIDHRPCIADYNSDSHVDAVDFDAFSACYNGPINPVSGNCLQLDFNGDHYVDAVDFDTFSGCYNGPANPPRC